MTVKHRHHHIIQRYLRNPFQALLSYLVFTMVKVMPLDLASATGGWLARKTGHRFSVNKVARRNLKHAFPEKSSAEIDRIVNAMWDNIGRTVFEFPQLHSLRMYGDNNHVEVVGAENIDLLNNDDKPGIFFAAHMANWEIPALSIERRGLPIHIIYRAPNNPLMGALFRKRAGELIPKGAKGAKRIIKLLQQGKHLGIMADQKMNDGITIPFFGRNAMTAPALAHFALKYGCPVVPVRAERLHGAHFRITCFPPIEIPDSGDKQADIAAIMTKVNAIIEEWIREKPEQWLWIHNRWSD